MGILALFSGYKTYVAAVGLLGLSVYQLSQGQFEMAYQTVMAALAATGLRHAISNSKQPGTTEVGS